MIEDKYAQTQKNFKNAKASFGTNCQIFGTTAAAAFYKF